MKLLQILAISGSLRTRSSSTSVLLAAQKVAPSHLQFTFFDGLDSLPHFNPDDDTDNPPARVTRFRAMLEASHGVILCTPEYAHGLPGAFKNSLDWTVSSGQWMQKPTLILNASPIAHFAHDSLVETLTVLMAHVYTSRLALPSNQTDVNALLHNVEIAAKLRANLADFSDKIQSHS